MFTERIDSLEIMSADACLRDGFGGKMFLRGGGLWNLFQLSSISCGSTLNQLLFIMAHAPATLSLLG